MPKRLTVIVSQGNSSNPAKRQLEEDIITRLMMTPGMDVTVVPSLYDLKPDSTGMLALRGVAGDLVVCSWLFERAAHWILDRNHIAGRAGTTQLAAPEEDDDEEEEEEENPGAASKPRVIERRELPNRWIYCLDLKASNQAQTYIDEILRIQKELSVSVVTLGIGNGKERAPGHALSEGPGTNGNGHLREARTDGSKGDPERVASEGPGSILRIDDGGGRRWYPVIDYSRCTNCLECIDFCLFGVYGVDKIDTILVEQPDNCRKGCPACSRVCPENAIMFPQHKTPAIAGSAEAASSFKIDLSQLFGAPEQGKSAAEIAALERDEQLVLAGRQAVGMKGLEKRQPAHRTAPRDELDALLDQLDSMDL